MPFHVDDTICAIATAPGGASRGMIRISGPSAPIVAARLFESVSHASIDAIQTATALPGHVRIEVDALPRTLPCHLFIWPTNRSYTREPIAELHTIGSPPLLVSLLDAVCRAGARLAEPGEFTLRAFLAGRLNLTQAEAVLGVIDARGTSDLECALAQLAGGLAKPLHELREDLLQLLAELEAGLDFVEEDIEFISPTEMIERLQSADTLLSEVASQMTSRHVASSTVRIALVGQPNVGKSSLFNAMIERFGCRSRSKPGNASPALVSPLRGTTRDYLTANISLIGVQCELVDTAGVGEDSCGSIDLMAQSVAVKQREVAVLRACCVEAGPNGTSLVDKSEAGYDVATCDIVVLTKADANPQQHFANLRQFRLPTVVTSSHTGQGLHDLAKVLHDLLTREEAAQSGRVIGATANRCRESVHAARHSIRQAIDLVQTSGGSELVAVELRAALEELGKVVGAVYTDDLLDRIFGTFCIGK